jgi:polysaccharide export outer membrane protein
VRKILASIVVLMVITGIAWGAEQPGDSSDQGNPLAAKEPAIQDASMDSTYPIGPGDVLGISIWKDDALTKEVVVLPDGLISFPLLGLVKAAGKTVAQLRSELEERISRYVTDPVLNVEVKQVNSMIIYVIGRVNSPGRFNLNTNVSALQALATAGGLNPFAKRDKIKILRQESGKTRIFPLNYDEIAEGRRLEENIELKRGDVIVVP